MLFNLLFVLFSLVVFCCFVKILKHHFSQAAIIIFALLKNCRCIPLPAFLSFFP